MRWLQCVCVCGFNVCVCVCVRESVCVSVFARVCVGSLRVPQDSPACAAFYSSLSLLSATEW
jgi:hypothetical protein